MAVQLAPPIRLVVVIPNYRIISITLGLELVNDGNPFDSTIGYATYAGYYYALALDNITLGAWAGVSTTALTSYYGSTFFTSYFYYYS